MTDQGSTIALWHQAGLTRPWNDPAQDFARAVNNEQSAALPAKAGPSR